MPDSIEERKAAYERKSIAEKIEDERKAFDAAKNEPIPVMGDEAVLPLVIQDLRDRSNMGEKKYGTVLKMFNGRNSLMDAYQEAGLWMVSTPLMSVETWG